MSDCGAAIASYKTHVPLTEKETTMAVEGKGKKRSRKVSIPNRLKGLLQEFFAQEHVRDVISYIRHNRVGGWEKWWQFELHFFLESHPDIEIASREKGRADIIYKERDQECLVLLQLKITRPRNQITDKMLKDVPKFREMGALGHKSVFCFLVGVHTDEDDEDLVSSLGDDYRDRFFSIDLAGTDSRCTVIWPPEEETADERAKTPQKAGPKMASKGKKRSGPSKRETDARRRMLESRESMDRLIAKYMGND